MMSYSYNIICLISLGSLVVVTQAGSYIPKRQYTFHVPKASERKDDVLGVLCLKDSPVIGCDVSGMDVIASEPAGRVGIVTQLMTNRTIHVTVGRDVDVFGRKGQIMFDVSLKCKLASIVIDDYHQPLLHTQIILKPDNCCEDDPPWRAPGPLSGDVERDVMRTFCPGRDDLIYDVIENTKPGRIDMFGRHRLPAGEEVVLSSELDSSDYLYFNKTTKELILLKSPDREVIEQLSVTLTCRVIIRGGSDVTTSVNVTVKVYDVNDNPPYTAYTGLIQLSNHSTEKDIKFLQTYDYDSVSITNGKSYRVYTNDTRGVIVLGTTNFLRVRRRSGLSQGTYVRTELDIVHRSLSFPYTVDVIVEDLTFSPSDGVSGQNKAIHRIYIPANQNVPPLKAKELSPIQLDIAAGKYSLVTFLPDHSDTDHTNVTRYEIIRVVPPKLKTVLAITGSGEVYVNDTSLLTSYKGHAALILTMSKTEQGSRIEEFSLSVTLTDNLRETRPEKCDLGCSIHNTEDECLSSCGYGALTGLCNWRNGGITISVNYSTCAPNLDTCPDGVCSELEDMDFLICPQDCSMGKITGQLLRWPPNNRGIYRAKGPCWCEREPTDGERYCICDPLTPIAYTPNKFNSSSLPAGHIANGKGQADSSVSEDDNPGVCGSSCRVAITGSLTGLVAVIILAAIVWMAVRHRRRRRAMALKHVSSLVSMTAVPSDYIVDDPRDSRGHVNRQTYSPASGHWPTKIGLGQDVFEDKWEFPRRYLTLEHVIGEGEFGQVVRAQAFMLRGQEGNTVVAVKMLKPDASGAEYQDLVSEFQLLKEVDHPNVIKLLGVCTQKGPLYVIVEYCELGSLRNFLRSSKFRNRGSSWDDKQKVGNEGQMASEQTETRILTCRDLFSFAWQIAKGMDYLAGLKIVHRDLAARNVLVTDGLMMKISDFGLSRDVYEADTYLKMSKGRIPVKWMAPESLYAQIYTTKSDIWSYGIVLWEIVTLGASPYPGIPPERLFPLLSTGYRMDRPDDCPEELYAIMQKCWKTEPENRPPFSVLRDILDNLLQQNTEYLDLSDDHYIMQGTNFGSDSDDKRAGVHLNSNNNTTTLSTSNKPQYSNVCGVGHTRPNVYITPHWPAAEDLDNEECPELSKLLGDNRDTEKDYEETPQKTEVIASKNGRMRADKLFVHENLTYV